MGGDYRPYQGQAEIRSLLPDMARKIITASRRNTSGKPTLAVLPFEIAVTNANEGDAEILAQLLAKEIANGGTYVVLPRTKSILQATQKEHEAQRSGLTDPDSIKAIGQAINAQYVLAGSIQQLGTKRLNAQILETESAGLVIGRDLEYKNLADSLVLIPELAARLTTGKKGGLLEPKALPLACVIIFMSVCYAGVTAFLDSYAQEGHAASVAPLYFIIYGAVILLVRPLAGKLLDKRGGNIVMLPSLAFFAVSLLVLSFAEGAGLFVLSAILMALGYGNILNMGQALAVSASPPERVGTATSTYFVFSDLGMGAGPLIMGLVASLVGFSGMYAVEAAVAALGIGLYWFLWGRRK
jgi:TolB-like protein